MFKVLIDNGDRLTGLLFESGQGKEISLFSETLRLAPGLTHPPIE